MPAIKNAIPWQATVKAAPAISDLQAISAFVRIADSRVDVGAPNYEQIIYTVPVGKILILQYIQALCLQADPTAIYFRLGSGGVDYGWYYALYGGAWESHKDLTQVVANAGEEIQVYWQGTLATTDVSAQMFGYLISKY